MNRMRLKLTPSLFRQVKCSRTLHNGQRSIASRSLAEVSKVVRRSRGDETYLITLAFPNRSRLPAAYNSSSPFCRSCLANQSLQIHLLAAYPSDEDDHTEPPLLSDYRKSLDTRYPIVCPSCAPAVEQDIAEKDARARSAALGWRLRESQKGLRARELKESERRNSWQWWWLGMVWRARGVAFWCTHASGILGCAAGGLFISVQTWGAVSDHLLLVQL